MKTVFADTSFYVALMNARDLHHSQAINFLRTHDGAVVTTDYVLIETGNFFRRLADRPYCLSLVENLRGDENAVVVPASQDLRDRGIELFRDRSDKEWSLTDCISIVVMEDRGLTEALTADRHFEQAGFAILLG